MGVAGRGVWRTYAVSLVGLACCWLATGASALPVERHYERVSPSYKGGYGVLAMEDVAVAGSGEGNRVQFQSFGSFAGAPNNLFIGNSYLAIRSPSEWSTIPVMLPSTPEMPYGNATASTRVSPSLELALFEGALTEHPSEDSQGTEEGPRSEEFARQRLDLEGVPSEVLYQPLSTIEGRLPRLTPLGVSPDLCHVVFQSESPLLTQAMGLNEPLYQISAGASAVGCGDEVSSLRLVAVDGEGRPMNPYCPPLLGGILKKTMSPNEISSNGDVFFTADPNIGEGECDGQNGYFPEGPAKLFVRLNGERTIEISQPLTGDCQGACQSAPSQRAVFTGADEAGTRVFFTTIQPLTTGDREFECRETKGRLEGFLEGFGEFETKAKCESDKGHTHEGGRWKRFGNDLYMATLACPGGRGVCADTEREATSLTQVSQSQRPGEVAEVQGSEAVTVSGDGKRIYFIARGVLVTGINAEGRTPVEGADNLYVYDVSEGRNHFVVDLCSGAARSGAVVDESCPGGSDSELWLGRRLAETTDDGQFLVFTSYGELTTDDTDTARDIYRYDARTETLERVSVGEDGADQNGNNSGHDVELPIMNIGGGLPRDNYLMFSRAISEDGSRIAFGTADPLSEKATNGLPNVYEWHDGTVSLVSSGAATGPEGEPLREPVVITPSGHDIFFRSSQGLVPQDADGLNDVYDARLGVGFPEQPDERRACEDGGCQGPLTNPAPVLVPGSISQAPGENFVLKVAKRKKAKKRKAKHHSGHERTRRTHSGKARRRRGR